MKVSKKSWHYKYITYVTGFSDYSLKKMLSQEYIVWVIFLILFSPVIAFIVLIHKTFSWIEKRLKPIELVD